VSQILRNLCFPRLDAFCDGTLLTSQSVDRSDTLWRL